LGPKLQKKISHSRKKKLIKISRFEKKSLKVQHWGKKGEKRGQISVEIIANKLI